MPNLALIEKIYDDVETAELALRALAELLKLSHDAHVRNEWLALLIECVARQTHAACEQLADYQTLTAA